jgi:hypothetical protein
LLCRLVDKSKGTQPDTSYRVNAALFRAKTEFLHQPLEDTVLAATACDDGEGTHTHTVTELSYTFSCVYTHMVLLIIVVTLFLLCVRRDGFLVVGPERDLAANVRST